MHVGTHANDVGLGVCVGQGVLRAGYNFTYSNTVYIAVLYAEGGPIGGIITTFDQNRYVERNCGGADHPHVENTGDFG